MTKEQAIKACILCQYLSNGFISIELFRYDKVEKYIYILAGGTIQIQIFENGEWIFL